MTDINPDVYEYQPSAATTDYLEALHTARSNALTAQRQVAEAENALALATARGKGARNVLIALARARGLASLTETTHQADKHIRAALAIAGLDDWPDDPPWDFNEHVNHAYSALRDHDAGYAP